jgi:diphthine synthase
MTRLGEIVFVGLGLHDEWGMSLRGLEEVKSADSVFLELYTNLLPGFSLKHLKEIAGHDIHIVSRKEIEEENGQCILKAAELGKTALLIPGDPLIATTHVTLRIEAEKRGIRTHIVHGASIFSAVIGLSGLHNYKFGKCVTIPFPDETAPDTPYNVIAQNLKLRLHTLCFLDIKTEEKRYLSIHDALEALLRVEAKRKEGMVTLDTLAVGIARAGSSKPTVKAGFLDELRNYDFGRPPFSLIFPGELHFMEAEALVQLAGAPARLREVAT